MSTFGKSDDLRDGHPHFIPCPAERHATDADPPMLHVRYLTTHRAWVLHCWARPECDYAEIAQLLGIEADADRWIGSNEVSALVAAYDHPDPDERPRLVFHSRREDGDSHEMAFRGTATGVHLLLWASDGPDSTLAVVGSEREAMWLMRAGVYRQGFVPVTWHRAVRRREEDSDSVSRVDWSRVEGTRMVFWPAPTREAHAEMYRAAGKALVAGATQLLMVDPKGRALSEDGVASSPPDLDDILGTLARASTLPALQDAADGDTASDDPPEPHPDADAADAMQGIKEILRPGPENTTGVSMAIRVLREHGHHVVLASQREGEGSQVEVYLRANSGELHRRPTELDLALWRSRATYMTEMLTLRDNGTLSATEVGECLRFVNDLASVSGRRAVIEDLPLAHRILQEHAAVPAGLRSVPAETIDADARYLGAPNGVIDLESGRLLSGTEARRALVSQTISDAYEPDASHPDIDRLTSHMDEEDREHLLDALAYALGGGSADRMYVIHGGLSRVALLSCVRLALGRRYSGAAPLGMLLGGRDRSEVPAQPTRLDRFIGPRILAGSAPAGSGSLDPGLLGDLTLSDAIRARSIAGDGQKDAEPTATMFVALDPDALEGFDGGAHPLARIRLLRYPDPESAGSELIGRAGRSRSFRQALVALLVRRCTAMTGPPDHIPHLAPPRSGSDTAADAWLLEAIWVTGRSSDRLASSALWEAARAAPGSGSNPDLAWGLSRRSLTMRAIRLHRLGRTRSVRIDGEVVTGWVGVRLARDGSDGE